MPRIFPAMGSKEESKTKTFQPFQDPHRPMVELMARSGASFSNAIGTVLTSRSSWGKQNGRRASHARQEGGSPLHTGPNEGEELCR